MPARKKIHNTTSPLTSESTDEIVRSFLIAQERNRTIQTTYTVSAVPHHGIVKPSKMKKLKKKKRRSTASASSSSNQAGPSDNSSNNNTNNNSNNGLAAVNVSANTVVAAPTENRNDEAVACDSLHETATESSADPSFFYNPPDAELDRKQDESMAESLLEFNTLGQDSYINPIAKMVPNLGINEHPLATLTNFEETILGESNPLTYGFLSQMVFVEDKLLPYASTSSESYEVACGVAGGEGQPPPYPVNIPRMLGNGPSLVDLRLPSNIIEYVLELLRTSSSPGSIFFEKFSQSEKDEKEAKDFGIYNPRHDDQQDKKDDDYDYNLN